MSEKLVLWDSDHLGIGMGLAVEQMIIPDFLLAARDVFVEAVMESFLTNVILQTGQDYIKEFGRKNQIGRVKFSIFGGDVIIEDPEGPGPGTLTLDWNRQTKWAEKKLSQNQAALEMQGSDYEESVSTHLSNSTLDWAKKVYVKAHMRRLIRNESRERA